MTRKHKRNYSTDLCWPTGQAHLPSLFYWANIFVHGNVCNIFFLPVLQTFLNTRFSLLITVDIAAQPPPRIWQNVTISQITIHKIQQVRFLLHLYCFCLARNEINLLKYLVCQNDRHCFWPKYQTVYHHYSQSYFSTVPVPVTSLKNLCMCLCL